jgi:hypothetical protein
MASIKITVLKDSERYFGDVQRKARQITGKYFNEAKRRYKDKAKPIHPEKAIRLAKKDVASVDHIVSIPIAEEVASKLSKQDVIAIGHDLAKGRKFNADLEM